MATVGVFFFGCAFAPLDRVVAGPLVTEESPLADPFDPTSIVDVVLKKAAPPPPRAPEPRANEAVKASMPEASSDAQGESPTKAAETAPSAPAVNDTDIVSRSLEYVGDVVGALLPDLGTDPADASVVEAARDPVRSVPRKRPRLVTLEFADEIDQGDVFASAEEPHAVADGMAIFALGKDLHLGTRHPAVGRCLAANGHDQRNCVVNVAWSDDIAALMDARTVIYRGRKAIVRYGTGGAERIYSIYPSRYFDQVSAYFETRYGAPERLDLPMAVIGDPSARNQVRRWTRSRNGRTEVLEIRRTDDLRDLLPDLEHGVIRLYRENGAALFQNLRVTDFLIDTADSGRTDGKP